MARSSIAAPVLALTAILHGDTLAPQNQAGVCTRTSESFEYSTAQLSRVPKQELRSTNFGVALAKAARQQTNSLVIYNDRYISIKYPMGDIPSLYGVCTDVVIRAYRALGVDLQKLVHESRIGNRDTSINHRRVRTLKAFFERYGEKLPVSDNPKDFAPGDLITYHRPQNTGTRMHIGIVADINSRSGRPMLIHNRGDGPQVEDALFFDKITGHFRYSGPKANSRGRTIATAKSRAKSQTTQN